MKSSKFVAAMMKSNKVYNMYAVKIGSATLLKTDDEDRAFEFLEAVKKDSPDAYVTRDGAKFTRITITRQPVKVDYFAKVGDIKHVDVFD